LFYLFFVTYIKIVASMTASTGSPSVIPLLSSWEAYIRTFPQGNIKGFAHWLLTNEEVAPDPEETIPTLALYLKNSFSGVKTEFLISPARRPNPPAADPLPTDHRPSPTPTAHPPVDLDETTQSTLLITHLYRVLGFHSKPVIKKLGFTKDMEFAVLVQVTLMGRPNKKELCRQLLIENSTGVEITKRLAKKGLLLEEADEKDRRSARLSLTEKGKTLLQKGYQQLGAIHRDFLNTLSPEEQKQLVALLTRLDNEHTRHIANLPPIS
jgi:DNA-binding MarR family transcriptional regulator